MIENSTKIAETSKTSEIDDINKSMDKTSFDPDKRAEYTEEKSDIVGNRDEYDPDKRAEYNENDNDTLKNKDDYDPDKRAENVEDSADFSEDIKEYNLDKGAEQSEKSDEKVESFEKLGGSYGELKKEGYGAYSEPPKEIHHMPAYSSYYDLELLRDDGPAIVMDKVDHRQTASCGNTKEAREYRSKQEALIKEGKFKEAVQMDIDDIKDKFGNKYDQAISQLKEYVNKLEEENRV